MMMTIWTTYLPMSRNLALGSCVRFRRGDRNTQLKESGPWIGGCNCVPSLYFERELEGGLRIGRRLGMY